MMPSGWPNRIVLSAAQLAPKGLVALPSATAVPPATGIFFN
jgi:hypothetical protein